MAVADGVKAAPSISPGGFHVCRNPSPGQAGRPLFHFGGRRFLTFAEPLVRVAAGLFLVPHGAQKLFGWFGGYGIDATGQFFAAKLGLPASLALVAGIIEFFGGLLLAAGIATRWWPRWWSD